MLLSGTLAAALCAWPMTAQAQPKKGPPPEAMMEEGPEDDRPVPPEGVGRHGPEGEEEKAVVEDLKQNHPEVFEHLMGLRKRKPEAFRQKLRGLRPMLKDKKFRGEAIENIEIELRTHKLVAAYRDAKDAKEKEKLKGEIRQALEKQFDSKLVMAEQRLLKMEEQIVELKSRIEKRRKVKKDLIDKRLGQITGDEEGWDW